MFSVRVERRLRAPGNSVWEAVSDFGEHHRLNPFIECSRISNDVALGEGAERELLLYDGSLMRQRIIDYRPRESMVMEVVEDGQWIRHHVLQISVRPETADSCVLAYRITFRPPLGWIGYPIGWLYKAILRSQYGHILRGVERHVQLGGDD